jgi:hypothetical protein
VRTGDEVVSIHILALRVLAIGNYKVLSEVFEGELAEVTRFAHRHLYFGRAVRGRSEEDEVCHHVSIDVQHEGLSAAMQLEVVEVTLSVLLEDPHFSLREHLEE